MEGESWFLVGSLVILLSTAAVTHGHVGCWVDPHSNENTQTNYTCKGENFEDLKIETFDPGRKRVNLINLYLAENRISYVERDLFHHLKKLKFLVLSGNLITSLDEDLFSNQKSLQYLDLSSNRLSKLPDRLFSSQDRLETLLLQENQLRTISIPLLTPLKSITFLNVSNNVLLCDCELRSAMLWCKERSMAKEATCEDEESGYISSWTQLEFVNICSENSVPTVLAKSVTPYMISDDRFVADSFSYVVPLIIVGSVAVQFMCFGLFLLYLRRRRPPSVSTTREERSVHSYSNSSHSYQYDYIQIPNIYKTPQLPARPIQTIGDLVHEQVDTFHNGHIGIHLKGPTLFETNADCDSCEEGHHVTEPAGKNLHRNNQQPVSSGVTSPVSRDLPEHDNPSKMAVSNCNTINRSSDASVMVENCLYSV